MVQTLNFINLSSQQAPNDVDWAGLVKAGVQGALIRLGHGIIRDPCASGHIAKAKQYGLYWHGYHTYEGVVNEPQFTIKNATELGLSNSQYYFADLTKSSDPFNDYYALHATWLSQGYSTGLLISNEDYLSKFNDSEVIASGTLRWLISDTEPDGYDVWQYSSEGTVGISSVKVGFNFAKTDKLKYNLNTTLTGADVNKDPYNPETPVGGAYIGWGYDTTGLGGGKTIGYSTDGKNFYALIGPDGLIVRKNDGNRIYGTISDQIDSAISANVVPAKSAADSAVSAANAAVESAQVTSDAVSAIASATAEAKQGANEAMSRAESAWDVATGAKEAVTDFDPLLKSAQSDAKQANETAVSAYEQSRSAYDAVKADSSAVVAMQSSMADFQEDVASAQSVADSAKADAGKALTQIADTASALSDAKTVFDSGVAEAKNLASKAQTTADSAVESTGENARALASQANALSDAKKAIDSDVASAKGLANAAQSTADTAIKSASSVANDLAAVASQANANASGITKVTSDVGLLQTTVADNSGNISKIQETATQLQQAVSDNSGNITIVKQTADSAVAVASDAKSNATVAVQTASGASVTAENAQSDATTAMVTASGAVTQASDAKSNATIAVQTASEASVTATNAQGDASFAKQTASDASVQIKNAQGDISKLQTRAGTIEASVSSNSGAIADVQATANQLKASVSDNAGNITVAKQTADSAVAVASDASSNATVAIQTASQASITASNASGQAASAVLTANGALTTASNAKSDATVAVQTASGASLTATNAQSDATIAKQTASEATIQASNAESDFAQLSIRANKIEANVATNSGAIASVQQTASGLTTTVGNVDNRVKTIEDKTNWTTKTGSLDMNTLTTTQNIYYRDTNLQNADGEAGWAYIQVVSVGERVTQTVWHDRSSIQHTRTGAVSGSSYSWDAWNKTATYDQVAEVKQTVDGLSTLVSDPKAGMTATYQTASQASLTAQNASGQAVTAVTTAQGAVTTANNAQSDAVVAKQTASEASVTASNAAGDASVAKQTASQASISVQNTQSEITSLDARADSLEAFQKDASGNINKLVSRADGVDQTLTNQAGDISSLQSRAGKLESSMSTADGKIGTLQQTASGLTTSVSSISDQLKASGHKVKVQSSTFNTSANYSDAGVWLDGTRVGSTGGGISFTMGTLNLDWSGYTQKDYATTSSLVSDLLALQDKIVVIYMADAIPPYGSDLVNALAKMGGDSKLATATSVSFIRSPFIFIGMSLDTNGNQVLQEGEGYLNAGIGGDGQVKYAWGYEGDSNRILTSSTIGKVTEIKTTVDGINTTINDPKTGLNATYQTAQGNATTISNVKGDVTQLQATANGLTSRVGNLESKTDTQQTAIDQNKAAIALKADQTTVDTLKGTVSQNTATLKTQADQIQSKVSASDVSGMLTGYATQSYTQSLVTQTADKWNLNLTSLQTDVNAIKTAGGGVNLLQGTRDFSGVSIQGDKVAVTNGGENFQAAFGTQNSSQSYFDLVSFNSLPLKKDTDYTASFWVKTSEDTDITSFLYDSGSNGVYADEATVNHSTTDYTRVVVHFHNGNNNATPNFIPARINKAGVTVWVYGCMLEEGTVAHTWSPAPSDLATVTSVANLSATVNGIQSQVYNSDGSSKITQLSSLIQSKVGTDDFNNLKQAVGLQTLDSADINNMKTNGHYFVHNLANNPVGGWVYVDVTGDGSTRIRQDVYQDNGTKHKYRRWVDTNWTDWEEGATYTEINQLQDAINLRVTKGDLISQINLQAGTSLIQSNKLVLDSGTTIFTGEAFIPSAAISSVQADQVKIGNSRLFGDDGTFNLVNPDAGNASIKLTTGTVLGSTQPVTEFSTGYNSTAMDISQVGTVIRPSLFFEDYPGQAKDNGWLGFSRHQTAELYFHTYDDTKELFRVACVTRFNQEVHVDRPIWQQGLSIASGNTIWSGSSFLAIGDHLSNSYTNVMARSFSSQSTLSSKTNIETVDPKDALDLVNRTDIRSYQYKADVAQGKAKRYTSLIIDDVHDVSQYYAPDEFTNEERTGRDDGSAVGYLFLAVKELTRRIKNLEEKLNG